MKRTTEAAEIWFAKQPSRSKTSMTPLIPKEHRIVEWFRVLNGFKGNVYVTDVTVMSCDVSILQQDYLCTIPCNLGLLWICRSVFFLNSFPLLWHTSTVHTAVPLQCGRHFLHQAKDSSRTQQGTSPGGWHTPNAKVPSRLSPKSLLYVLHQALHHVLHFAYFLLHICNDWNQFSILPCCSWTSGGAYDTPQSAMVYITSLALTAYIQRYKKRPFSWSVTVSSWPAKSKVCKVITSTKCSNCYVLQMQS